MNTLKEPRPVRARKNNSLGLSFLKPSPLQEKSPSTRFSILVDRIVDNIETDILFGEYRPREHLVQGQLTRKYGVERNVIRSVLKKLEERSVVEHFPHRGSMVKEFTAKNAKDLYRIRMLLEGIAAEMAIAKITPQAIHQLETLSKEMGKCLRQGKLKAFSLAHEKFHQLIFETADNYYLLKVIKELISASSSIRYFSYSRYSVQENKYKLLNEHQEIITCLRKKDARKIGQIARFHLKSGINHYLLNFFPQESLIE
jgi:DNA-binding GntR family transcriptional regulator